MRIFIRHIAFLTIIASLLISCGGGGETDNSSGSWVTYGGSGSSITYSGKTTPATLDANNAETVATEAYQSGGTGTAIGGRSLSANNGSAGRPTILIISEALENAFNSSGITTGAGAAKAVYSQGLSPDYNCAGGPGNGTASFDINDQTGYFTGSFGLNGLCSDGVKLTGIITTSGQLDLITGKFISVSLSFYPLEAVSNSSSSTASGTITFDYTGQSVSVTMDMLLRDNASSKVYKVENHHLVFTPGANYLDVTIVSGRFYHPDHGYVDVTTVTPLRYFNDEEWPSAGVLVFTGSSGSRARLELFLSESYRIETDSDGDGSYESNSGVQTWPGTDGLLEPPTADAGPDQNANIGDLVTLDGGGSSDIYGYALTYSWSFASVPSGSTAVLSGADTVSPSFVADKSGTYVVSLVANDGSQDSTPDTIAISAQPIPIFSTAQVIPTGSMAQAVAIGDVNSDGLNDVVVIAVALYRDNEVQVFLQNALGGLDPAVIYPLGYGGSSIADVDVGDVNNDGREDVVLGFGGTGQIGVLLQNSSGTLDPMVTYSTPSSQIVKIVDLDNDGLNDVVAVSSYFKSLEVFLQDNTGALVPTATYNVNLGGIREVGVGDINSDGLLDIIVVNWGGGYYEDFAVLLQRYDGTFDLPVYYDSGGDSRAMAIGDINSDNIQEVVLACRDSNQSPMVNFLGVFLQNGTGTLDPVLKYIDYTYGDLDAIEIADVNNDGRSDVVGAGFIGGGKIFIQQPDGTLLFYMNFATYSVIEPRALAVGDINNDGKIDLATTRPTSGLVVYYNIY